MTQEEKAKAYDMALERASKIKNGEDNWRFCDLTEISPALEEVFPELAESEDERIIKLIRSLLENVRNVQSNTSLYKQYDDALSWLEKQKYDRMKPIYDARESFESALEKAWNDYHNGYENVDKLEDDYVECAHAKGFREGYLFGIEKQKEKDLDIVPELRPTAWGEGYQHGCRDTEEKYKEQKHYWKPTETDVALFNKAVTTNKTLTPTERAQLDIVRSKFSRCCAINCSGIVQKEQKPIDPSDDELQRHQDELYDFKVFAAKQAKEHHISFVHDFEWNNFCAEILSYFNEQKPVQDETEREYVRTIKSIITDFIRDKKPEDVGYYQQIYDWLDGRHIEQKPVEWTDDDEAHMKWLCRIVYSCRVHGGLSLAEESELGKWMDKWLNHNPQPKQEWSEEDEKKLKLAIHSCEMCGNPVTASWLKSLRPSWKPSEEQMEALEYVIRDYREDSCNATADYLQEILDHLKNM